MRNLECEKGKICISEERYKELKILIEVLGIEQFLSLEMLKDFIGEYPKRNEFIELYSHLHNLNKYAVLAAHGTVHKNKWYYHDDKSKPVQEWIDREDGKYSTLLIHVCNSLAEEISSKKSIILVPNNIYSPIRQDIGEVKIEMFIPGIGYLDDYVFEHELNKLKEKVEGR